MINYLTHGLIMGFIVFQLVVLVIVISNIFMLHRSTPSSLPVDCPAVSVLVPARNEEKSIAACVKSLQAQEYPKFEVIVLDDQSSDGTLRILEQLEASWPGLKVITGTPPPAGFTGKNWACTQLASHATGDLLLFTDADTVYQPQALSRIVAYQLAENADLVTGYPHQLLGSWGERLLVPFFLWAVMCFNPLWLAYRQQLPLLSSAVGQMLLFRRLAYQHIGGHTAVGGQIVEDLALAKRIKQAGLRWRVFRLTDLVSCRMYQSSRAAYEGFSKNLFALFNFRLAIYLFVFIFLGMAFLEPLLVLGARLAGYAPQASYVELALCIGLSLLVWCLPYAELRFPVVLGFIYPLTMLASEAAAFRSLVLSLTGGLTWKGRPLERPKWKWL